MTTLRRKLQRIKRKINTGRPHRSTCLSVKCSVSRQYNKCTPEKKCLLKLHTHVYSFRHETGMLLIKTFVVLLLLGQLNQFPSCLHIKQVALFINEFNKINCQRDILKDHPSSSCKKFTRAALSITSM